MDELLCQGEDGGEREARGWHMAGAEDTIWSSEKGQNIWPERIIVEQ